MDEFDSYTLFYSNPIKKWKEITTICEGLIQHSSTKIEFPHQIIRSPCHFTPFTRWHVTLFQVEKWLNLGRIWHSRRVVQWLFHFDNPAEGWRHRAHKFRHAPLALPYPTEASRTVHVDPLFHPGPHHFRRTTETTSRRTIHTSEPHIHPENSKGTSPGNAKGTSYMNIAPGLPLHEEFRASSRAPLCIRVSINRSPADVWIPLRSIFPHGLFDSLSEDNFVQFILVFLAWKIVLYRRS